MGSNICVAVAAGSAEQMAARARAVLADESLIELRLDSLPQPASFLPLLAPLLADFPAARVLVTCRRLPSGGGFSATIEAELAVLGMAAKAGCAAVDLALETAEAMRADQHRQLRAILKQTGTALLISYHDFEGTRDLPQTMARILRHRPQIVKIVSTATSLHDNLAVLDLLAQDHRCEHGCDHRCEHGCDHGRALVALAMGDLGLPSRVLGPRAGALFTFAAASPGASTAPGQTTAATLRSLYRLDQISPSTRIFSVAGKPIAQSLSPLMHNAAFASQGVDAVLLPLLTSDAAELVRFLRELPLWGASVTMPLKQAVLPLLDSVDPLAARVGACNTIVRREDGSLHGYNTDVAGVVVPLEQRMPLKGARILVRGAGGAARAAVFGLRDKGAEVWIVNRSQDAAERLAAEAGAHVLPVPGQAGSLVGSPGATPAPFDALIHAVPSGMAGFESTGLEERKLEARLVFDMVYNPIETAVIRQARAEGIPVITGAEMFVHQGARQFTLWTGRPAPRDQMAKVVLEALRAREQAVGVVGTA